MDSPLYDIHDWEARMFEGRSPNSEAASPVLAEGSMGQGGGTKEPEMGHCGVGSENAKRRETVRLEEGDGNLTVDVDMEDLDLAWSPVLAACKKFPNGASTKFDPMARINSDDVDVEKDEHSQNDGVDDDKNCNAPEYSADNFEVTGLKTRSVTPPYPSRLPPRSPSSGEASPGGFFVVSNVINFNTNSARSSRSSLGRKTLRPRAAQPYPQQPSATLHQTVAAEESDDEKMASFTPTGHGSPSENRDCVNLKAKEDLFTVGKMSRSTSKGRKSKGGTIKTRHPLEVRPAPPAVAPPAPPAITPPAPPLSPPAFAASRRSSGKIRSTRARRSRGRQSIGPAGAKLRPEMEEEVTLEGNGIAEAKNNISPDDIIAMEIEENEVFETTIESKKEDSPSLFITPIKTGMKQAPDSSAGVTHAEPIAFSIGCVAPATVGSKRGKTSRRGGTPSNTGSNSTKSAALNRHRHFSALHSPLHQALRSPLQSPHVDVLRTLRNEAANFLASGKLRLAEQKLDQAIATHPSDAASRLLRAQALARSCKFKNAILDCAVALRQRPVVPEAQILAARLFRNIGCFSFSLQSLSAIDLSAAAANANANAGVDEMMILAEAGPWLPGNDSNNFSSLPITHQHRVESEKLQRATNTFRSACQVLDSELGMVNPTTHVAMQELPKLCPGWPCAHLILAVALLARKDIRPDNSADAETHAVSARAYTYDFTLEKLDATASAINVNNCSADTGKVMTALMRQVHRRSTTFKCALKVLDLVESVFVESPQLPVSRACRDERAHISKLKKAKDAANALFSKQLYSQAVFRYGEALKLDSLHDAYNGVILCNRAAALMALKQYEQALADCDAALLKQPKYNKARVRRARVFIALNKTKQALVDFEQAARQDPDDKKLLVEIEALKNQLRRMREAKNQQREQARYSKYERRRWQAHPGNHADAANGRSNDARDASGLPPEGSSFYLMLDLEQSATSQQIKKAYFKLARAHHPDKGGDANVFKRVVEAYEVLGDNAKRVEYDRKQRSQLRNRFSSFPPSTNLYSYRTNNSYCYYC